MRHFRPALGIMSVLSSLALAVSAQAQDRSTTVIPLLNHVPPDLLATGSGATISFTDLSMTSLRGDWTEYGQPLAGSGVFERVDLPGLGQSLFYSTAAELQRQTGIPAAQISAALAISRAPDKAQLLALSGAAAARVGPALVAKGYQDVSLETLPMFQRGDMDYTADPAMLDPADPFGDGQGMASRIVLTGPLLAQANSWDMADALSQPQPPRSDLDAIALALDDPELGDPKFRGFALLQATVLLDQAATSPGHAGIPPWQIGLLADLASNTGNATMAIFVYTDRTDAEAAQATLTKGWDGAVYPASLGGNQTLGAVVGGQASVTILGEGPFAVALTTRTPLIDRAATGLPPGSPDALKNRAYLTLLRGIQSGQMPLFGPA